MSRPLFSMFNVLSLAALLLSWGAWRVVQAPPATPQPPTLELAERKTVQGAVYYSDSQVQGFVRQNRDLQVTQSNPASLAQAALNAWAAGPAEGSGGAVAVVPKGTPAPSVWVRGDHFVVDLPAAYGKLNYGSSGERMVVCSLVRTLLESRGKDVTFLLGGKNADTLLGHSDLRSPYARADCAGD